MRKNPDANLTNRILKRFWNKLLEHVHGQKQLLPDFDNLKPFSESGSWGNVYPTLTKDIVLKVTINDNEEDLVNLLLHDPQEGFVRFFDIYKMNTDGMHPSWAIWREEVNQVAKDYTATAAEAAFFKAVYDTTWVTLDLEISLRYLPFDHIDHAQIENSLEQWWNVMDGIKDTNIGKSLIHFARKGLLFSDLHLGNVGFGTIGKDWKIIDCHPIKIEQPDALIKFLERKMKRKNPAPDEILFVVKATDSYSGVSAKKMHEVAQRYVVGNAMKAFIKSGIVTDSLEFEVEEAIRQASHMSWKTKNKGYEDDEKVLSALQDLIDNHTARIDYISGGKADSKSPTEFNQKQLAIGMKHEREHTSDDEIAREIAMDHLTEDPDYYIKLQRMEKRKNPAPNAKLGYYLADGKEFPKIVVKGMLTTYDPEFGRVFFFGTDPNIVIAKKRKSDQLLRFTFPSDTQKTHRSVYDYNCYSKKLPRSSDIEVYLGGDINEDDSWSPVVVLR